MNICKFYKRNKDGTVAVLRIRVTQNFGGRNYNGTSHLPSVAKARQRAAGKGFTHKRRRSDRLVPEAA